MCAKVLFSTSLILVLVLAGGAWAATWTGLGDGTSWNDPANWDTGVPGSAEDVRMDCPPTQGPIIDGDVDCGQIEGPAYAGSAGCLSVMEILSGTVNIGGQWRFANEEAHALVNISGGDITVNGDWRWADSSGGYATVNVTGGTVTTPRLKIGDLGGGELNISGDAVVTINGEFDMDGDEAQILTINGGTLIVAQFGPNANAKINLDAGTFECMQYEFGAAVLDINDGVLYVDGDVTAAVDADVAIDLITAYNGDPDGEVHREYVDGVTRVWATTTYTWARNPSPASPADNLCPDAVVLGWTPGLNADRHDVYVGTDYDDVKNATTSDSGIYKGRQEAATYDAGSLMSLQPGETYYWKIDEVDLGPPEEIVKAKYVWQFAINDGNAFGPDPAHNKTAVPLDVTLTWSAGCSAQSHKVFFGTDEDQVRNMVDPCATRTLGNENYSPDTLDYSTFYYWRIDEVGPVAEVWKGSVWRFKSQGAISDVNMTAYYKFDETGGLVARDSSGYDNHASIIGATDADWEPNNGHFDGCIKFNDDESYAIAVPAPVTAKMSSAVTVALWINDEPGSTDEIVAFDAGDLGDSGNYKLTAMIPDSMSDVSWRAGDGNDVLVWEQAKPSVWRGEWHHFAFLKDEVADTMKIYFDGFVVDSKTDVAQSLSKMKGSLFHIGAGNDDNGTDQAAMVDDFRFYDRALSDNEIAGLYRGGDVELAWAPKPYDGESDVSKEVVLKWKPGDYAVSHIVYMGTNWDDVNDAATTSGEYKGIYGPNEYDPCGLDMKTTYYWRIDEVNGPNTWKGKVWRFTVADFIVVDDMESYSAVSGSGNEIFDTWDDGFVNGTGAQIDLEYAAAANVHTGSQSMKFGYTPYGAFKFSEVDANTTGPRPGNLDIGKNWTIFDVKALTLFFYGDANNTVEQMYLALEDTSKNIHISNYGDMGQDLNDIKVAEWHQWDIAMSEFSDAGVTITDVNKVRIGFGDRVNPVAGGSGYVFFDDIRLYLPKCLPSVLKPQYDLSNNCIVDFADVAIMAGDWLLSDVNVNPVVEPNAPVLRYLFDESSGTTVADSVGGYTGTFFIDMDQTPAEISGRMDPGLTGNSFHFHSPDYGAISIPDTLFTAEGISQDITVAVWIKNAHPDETPDGGAFMWEFREWDGVSVDGGPRVLAVEAADDGDDYIFRDQSESVSYSLDWDNHTNWQHYAFVRTDANLAIYVNGVLAEISDSNGNPMTAPDLLYVGMAADLAPGNTGDMHDGFTGNMDNWEIYDYALSDAEIGYLGTGGTGISPVQSPANLYDEEPAGTRAVNLRDYALLVQDWLQEMLWPE